MKRIILALFVFIPLSFVLCLAQTGRGVIRGVVRDEMQAVIPGADVKLTHRETNFLRSTVSTEVGVYYFGALPRGNYQLNVSMPGFQERSTDLELFVGQTEVIPIVLQVAGETIQVEVLGSHMLANPDSSEIAGIKEFERIQQLPLNGRFVSNLFELTPGVEMEPAGRPGDARLSARVNGQKVGSLEITYDGVSMVDRFGGGFARVQPGLDTIQEFRIETVGSDARYSRPATVTLLSRSGTNHFHGSAFWKHRNNGFGLRARRREEQDEEAKLLRNEFGVTMGGPVVLGKLYDGRDKSFWFFSYEGLRERQGKLPLDLPDYQLRRVPTEAMWNGDLSNLLTDGEETTIYDPLTTDSNGLRQPFPDNVIPADRIHPFGKKLALLTARPTNEVDPNRGNNFLHFYPYKIDLNSLTAKWDQVLTERDNFSLRWTYGVREFLQDGGLFGNPSDPSATFGTLARKVPVTNVAANYTHTFSAGFLNELLVGVHRSNHHSGNIGDDKDWPAELGLPNPFGATGWPEIVPVEGAWITPWAHWSRSNMQDQALTAVTLEDNATWVRGKHVIQLGGRFRREHNNIRLLQDAQGGNWLLGDWTGLYESESDSRASNTGHGFADLLLGLPDPLWARHNRGYFYFRQNEVGLYFMDKWAVTPRLTLSLGARWDKWTPYREKYDRLAAIDSETLSDKFEVVTPRDIDIRSIPGIPSSVFESWANRGLSFTTAREIGYPDSLYRADNNNLGLRISASYMFDRKTVLRGGFGEYFWPTPLSQVLGAVRLQAPLDLTFRRRFYEDNKDGTWTLKNSPGPENFVGNVTIDTDNPVSLSSTARRGALWDGRNWKDGHSRAWHLTLEHEVMKDTLLRASYLGNRARDLEQRYATNSREARYNYVARTGEKPTGNSDALRPNPNWKFESQGTSEYGITLNRTGYANTHSGQIELERRFLEGLGFQVFYVYTQSKTTTDANGFSGGAALLNKTASSANLVPEWSNLFQYENELGIPPTVVEPSYDDLLKLAYLNSVNIPRHRIRFNGIASLPFGQGRRWGADVSGALNRVIGGWQVAFIGNWRSGFWRSVAANRFQFADPRLSPDERLEITIDGQRKLLWFRGDFDPADCTADCSGLTNLVPSDQTRRAIRPAGAGLDNKLTQELADGNTTNTRITELFNPDPRNFYMGPGGWGVDLSIFKHFPLTEDLDLRFTADFFNVFNHPIDSDPDQTTGLVKLGEQINEPRIIQLSLQLNW